jgi:hypothetical protein
VTERQGSQKDREKTLKRSSTTRGMIHNDEPTNQNFTVANHLPSQYENDWSESVEEDTGLILSVSE